MGDKRHRPYDNFDRDRGRDHGYSPKRQRTGDYGRNDHNSVPSIGRRDDRGYQRGTQNDRRDRGPPTVSQTGLKHKHAKKGHFTMQPEFLTKEETQSGLIVLLDQLAADEAGPDGDANIHRHAEQLRMLLSTRANKTLPSEAKKELDRQRPESKDYPRVAVPPYIAPRIKATGSLPPLPQITDPLLREAVFTHRSMVSNNDEETMNYEKLEFLGDAYIEIVSSRIIFTRFPHLEPARLSHTRQQIVCNETLAKYSRDYGFGERIKHAGKEDEGSGWTKILADSFEAYVAAVVLSDPDHGFTTIENWLTELWTPQLLAFKDEMVSDPNAKTKIQNLAGSPGIILDYRKERDVVEINGTQIYHAGLYLTGWGYTKELLGKGEARNKQEAGARAATFALKNERSMAILQDCQRQKLEKYPQIKAKLEQRQKEQRQAGGIGVSKVAESGMESANEVVSVTDKARAKEEKKEKKRQKKLEKTKDKKRSKDEEQDSSDGVPGS